MIASVFNAVKIMQFDYVFMKRLKKFYGHSFNNSSPLFP